MTVLLFQDNTVLINFAHIHRMDLLGRLARNGAWCATVLAEEQQIQVITTWDLLRVAARGSLIDGETLWSYILILRQKGRGGPPGVRDRASFERWVVL